MSDRVKVLMLVDALNPGGAERFLVGLATNLPASRYEVTVCTTRAKPGTLAQELEAAGIRVETLGRSGRFDVAPFRRLWRLLREERFDVLHAHKFGSNLWGTIFGRLARVPVVVAHEQTWSYEGQPLRRFLDGRVIARLADSFVAVSTRDQERMVSVEHAPAEKTTYIPNAFMPPAGAPPQGDLRAEIGVAADVPLAGTLVVHRQQKAIDVLIDAWALVVARLPEARLAIGGAGPMTAGWQEHARSRGVADAIHWIGLRSDAPVVLDALDVAVMSSDYEGTPLFAFECMAAGVPFCSTDVGGLRDVFVNGESALLVPPRDSAALAEALVALLSDAERRRAVASAARERLSEFTVERAVARVEELYGSLLAAKGRSPAIAAPVTARAPTA